MTFGANRMGGSISVVYLTVQHLVMHGFGVYLDLTDMHYLNETKERLELFTEARPVRSTGFKE
jgi:hypothetical protein